MKVLRRDTLQWEEIDLKKQKVSYSLALSDGKRVDFRNALAVDGEIKRGHLGYCSSCYKVMTKGEYDKHTHKEASIKTCTGCYYLQRKDDVLIKKNGKYEFRSNAYCQHERKDLCPGLKCTYQVCQGEFKKDGFLFRNPVLPSKILTVKAFLNDKWILEELNNYSGAVVFKHYKYNLKAFVDKNGYFLQFIYKGTICCYDNKRDKLITHNGGVVTESEVILKIMRRLYENQL